MRELPAEARIGASVAALMAEDRETFMKRHSLRWLAFGGSALALLITALIALDTAPATAADTVVVYKSPTCNCCLRWIGHLRQAGFRVEARNETAMNALKAKLGVPGDLASCHTATVNGYVIEGHVPAQDIRRLLTEKPAATGLAVPGMPVGSPGMEQGSRVDSYKVLLFDTAGPPVQFAQHGTPAD